MVAIRYLLQALVASILDTTALGRAIKPHHHGQLSEIQHPLGQYPQDKPGCDGSGVIAPGNGDCNGDGLIDNPNPRHKDREGFHFENPSTDCAYVTQMHIWDSFKDLEKDMNKLFTLIHKDVNFTVVGHHPIAGHYNDLMHFYVNALRRVSVLFLDHADKFEIHPQAIHGGCNQRWSVQEVQFKGIMNTGKPLLIISSHHFS